MCQLQPILPNHISLHSHGGLGLSAQVSKGANFLDPDSVKDAVANQEQRSTTTKAKAASCYKKYARLNGIPFQDPHYKQNRKLPFIPLEEEIDQLITEAARQ